MCLTGAGRILYGCSKPYRAKGEGYGTHEVTGNLEERLVRVTCSLEGLSVGDAFGEQFFHQPDGSENCNTTQALPLMP